MDTRSKILTIEAASRLSARPLVIVSGTFDVLRAAHARELEQRAMDGGKLLVAVLPSEFNLLPQRARAELVAALRVVDYVVATGPEELEALAAALQPAALVRLEHTDAERARQLIEHVRRKHER